MREEQAAFEAREASMEALARIWAKNIAANRDDVRWVHWRDATLAENRAGRAQTFVTLFHGEPVGEGTLLFSPLCGAIAGRSELADGERVANINALRIEKAHEGQGHISALVRLMEARAAQAGYQRLTIGVEARETRSLAIYLHWGYDAFVRSDMEEGTLVLYYAKEIGRA